MILDLYKDLLKDNSVMEMVFLLSVSHEQARQIADNTHKLFEQRDDSNDRSLPIEVSLRIDGIELDPVSFFEALVTEYNNIVKREASKMVKEQTSGKMEEIIEQLMAMQNIATDMSQDLNWDVTENIFQKRDL